MKLGTKIKETIARVIGTQFSTDEIVNVFKDAGISTDVSLYAKWRITLDGFSRITTEDGLFHVISEFCHPLNFKEPDAREVFINNLNNILSYEELEIQSTEKAVRIVSIDGRAQYDFSKASTEEKSSTDYVVDAVNFFKNEYNKVRIAGLSYDYSLGENVKSEQTDQDYDDYENRLRAIERLGASGFITEFEIEERVESDGYYVWDYAVCKIDETRLTGQKATPPPATEAGAKAVAQEVIHTHTHRFENNIQEKPIDLNHVHEKPAPSDTFYITKKDDDFYYKGRYINLSKKTQYYKVFCALFSKLPEGGEVSYAELAEEVKSRIPSAKSKDTEAMKKLIQSSLTDKQNGFVRYAGIPETEDNGKPLIEVSRGSGVVFNNKPK